MIAVSFPHSICPLWTQLGLSGKAWTHASCTVSSSSLSLDFKVDFFFCLHKLLLFFQKQTRKNWIPTLKTMFKREKYCIQVLTNSCSTNLWILNISVLLHSWKQKPLGLPIWNFDLMSFRVRNLLMLCVFYMSLEIQPSFLLSIL